MKKFILPIILILVFAFVILKYIDIKGQYKTRLEIIGSHNLYLFLNSYQAFVDDPNNQSVSLDSLNRLQEISSNNIEIAKNIDNAVGYQIIELICLETRDISIILQKDFAKNDIPYNGVEIYKNLISTLNEVIFYIYENYYDKNDHYGGKINIDNKNFDHLEELLNNLKDIKNETKKNP